MLRCALVEDPLYLSDQSSVFLIPTRQSLDNNQAIYLFSVHDLGAVFFYFLIYPLLITKISGSTN